MVLDMNVLLPIILGVFFYLVKINLLPDNSFKYLASLLCRRQSINTTLSSTVAHVSNRCSCHTPSYHVSNQIIVIYFFLRIVCFLYLTEPSSGYHKFIQKNESTCTLIFDRREWYILLRAHLKPQQG